MKSKLLLLFVTILFSVTIQAQNTIEIVNPPPSVEGNTNVDITFNYTLAVKGHAFIRFKNGPETENNITEATVFNLEAGTGTLTVSLEVPRSFNGAVLPLGNSYNYQAQLFDEGWAGLATVDYNGVTLTAASNFMEITNPPSTVNVDGSVDLTFDYATNKGLPVYAFVRLHDADGNQVASTSPAFEISSASGSAVINLPIPADVPLGENYEFRALLFHPSNWGVAIATSKVLNITVEAFVAPANYITLTNAPTTVNAGADVDITFNYATDIANAHIFIRFKGAAGNLTDVSKIVTAGSGTLTLPLPIPSDALGSGYSYQAQLFDIDEGYANIVSNDIPDDITVEAAPAKTIAITNPPTEELLIESTLEVTLNFTKDITEDVVALVRFIDASGNSVTQAFDYVSPNSGSITLTLDTPTTEGTYVLRAELHSENFDTLYYKKSYPGITISTSLSTDNFKNSFKNLSVSPNPFTDSFSYKFDENLSGSTEVELFTIDGRKVKTINSNDTAFGNSGTVSTKHLSKGIYLVRITSGKVQETRKLIKM